MAGFRRKHEVQCGLVLKKDSILDTWLSADSLFYPTLLWLVTLAMLYSTMRSAAIFATLLAVVGINCNVNGFVMPSLSSRSAIFSLGINESKLMRSTILSTARPSSSTQLMMSALDGIKGPVQFYVDIWTPMFKTAQESGLLPDFILHWGHGAAMGSVLLSMGLIGAYMGWQNRLGNGEDVTPLTLGETIREAHPKIIGGAFFFFLLGGQGGLVLLDAQDKSILESPHAMTAVLSVVLLTAQALLPKLFATENGALARNVHAYLGTATMAVLFAHMATGLNLGLSF